MIALLLDSSSNRLSIALAKDGKVFAYFDEIAFQTQSEIMTSEINNLLASNKLKPNDINLLVVAYGPGSFTGVRIAVSVSKVWAYALNVPVYAVSSLSVFKDNIKPTICVLDARNGRSFAGVYQHNKVLVPDQIMLNADVLKLAQEESYLINGEVKHLNVESGHFDRFQNMLDMVSDDTRVRDVASFKPIYLKG